MEESEGAKQSMTHKRSRWTAEQSLRAFVTLVFCVPSLFGLLALIPASVVVQAFLKVVGVHRNNLPIDVFQSEWCYAVLSLMGVEVVVEGEENVPLDRPCLLMFNHVSQLDPLIILSHSPLTARFIGKRSVFQIPVFGWVVRAFGHIPIERENLDRAVQSIKDAGRLISESGSAVAVSPEGTRSSTGSLIPFKKGPFYLAKESKVDIVPCILDGAFDLWKPRTLFAKPGVVKLVFLPLIKNDGSKSRGELSAIVRKAMEDYFETHPTAAKPKM